jgi:molybdopterin-guanine dinucleotide biosynthesis protein A
MGRDKALLPFHGRPLAAAIAAIVQEAAGSAALIGDPALAAATGFPVLPDLFPGEGPLGGILTALRAGTADWNLVTACDMPALTPDFLRRLFEAAEAGDPGVLLPVAPAGRPEPLCAVWHRRALSPLEIAFAAGTRKVTDALRGLHVVRYPCAEVTPFQNVNTPEDWSGYAAE